MPIYPGCHSSTSHIPLFLSVYGGESYTGAKVKGHESCLWSEGSKDAKVPWNESSWNIRSWGAKVPQERKFHGTKVLGLFAPRERMFHGTKVPRERKFSLWPFRSRERKCRGTKRPVTLCPYLKYRTRWYNCIMILRSVFGSGQFFFKIKFNSLMRPKFMYVYWISICWTQKKWSLFILLIGPKSPNLHESRALSAFIP